MTIPKEVASEMNTAPTMRRPADTSSVGRRPIESRSMPETSKPPNPATKFSPDVATSFSNVDMWSCDRSTGRCEGERRGGGGTRDSTMLFLRLRKI